MSAFSSPAAVARVLAWRPALVAVHLASMAVLSRLLGPEAFGIFAIVVAAVVLAEVAIDFGVSPNLTRGSETELPQAALRAAIGLWLAASLGVTALFAAGAAILWALGGAAAPSLAVTALAFPIAPVTLAAEVVLWRRLDMRVLAWLPAAAALFGLLVAASAALAGIGAASLAMGIVAERALTASVLVAAQGRLFPARPSFAGWGAHLTFGGTYTATVLLPKIAAILRLSILGAQLGTGAVGLLNRALAVAELNDRAVLKSVLPLGLPIMAKAARSGIPEGEIYRAKIDYLIVLCWPATAVVAILAGPLVRVLLGPGWEATVPLVRILALSGLTYPVTKMGVKFFALIGAERTMLAIQARQQVLSLVLVGAASFASITWACAALVAAQWIKAARVAAAVRRLGADHGAYGPLAASGARATLGASAVPVALVVLAPEAPDLAVLAIGLAGAGACWAAVLAACGHPLAGHARRLAAGGA